MANPLKKWIQDQLYNRCLKRYQREVDYQNNRYARYLETHGQSVRLPVADGTFCPDADGALTVDCGSFVLFLRKNGILDDRARTCFAKAFSQHPSAIAAYCDEDYVDHEGERHSPWFKPRWSPDTFFDSFYFGSVFALKKELLEAAGKDEKGKPVWEDVVSYEAAKALAYGCIANHLEKEGVVPSTRAEEQAVRIEELLFHGYYDHPRKGIAEYEQRQNPIEDARFDRPIPADAAADTAKLAQDMSEPFISVIIPSKDNPEVLARCIQTLKEKTEGIRYELIVVDNGSSGENREKIQALCGRCGASYEYEKMEFNFSKMCNHGASKAKGNYLLFLNDDMEIVQADWMRKMQKTASLSHVGAVGAKLLYPDSTVIQHAGVTNLEIGPAHKLQHDDDRLSYYHGQNRGIHDMLAVTAACLMVAKEKYEQAGGFREALAVAYNDVDFCFALYENGYYNVQRNDIILYHHESLSRGNDELSEGKWGRLLKEKKKLYEQHPGLCGQDPFYSKGLAGNFSDYICSFEYPYEKRAYELAKKPKPCKDPTAFENGCLMIRIEQTKKQRKTDLNDPDMICHRIEGWSYVLHGDSMRYQRFLILRKKNTENYYQLALCDRLRVDAQSILEGESEHTALAGFYVFALLDGLEKGEYELGMLAKDRCSTQKLFAMTQDTLIVE